MSTWSRNGLKRSTLQAAEDTERPTPAGARRKGITDLVGIPHAEQPLVLGMPITDAHDPRALGTFLTQRASSPACAFRHMQGFFNQMFEPRIGSLLRRLGTRNRA